MEYSVSESLGEGWGDVRLVFIAEREQEHAREKERERECVCLFVGGGGWGYRDTTKISRAFWTYAVVLSINTQ